MSRNEMDRKETAVNNSMTDETITDPRQLATGGDDSRSRVIVRTSVVGILVNVVLAGFKAAVGMLANSIAITLDAVNNLSDALSSVITIIGTKLAGKAPDKKHPYGYGRIEYLSAMIISVIVLYAGVTSLVESVKKIIHPETPDYSAVSLVIVGVAVGAKLLLGTYVKKTGKRVNSESLVDSGSDALMDSIISAATLVAAAVYLTTHLKVEAYLGAVISVVIIKSAIDMLRSTLSQILGERADPHLTSGIKRAAAAFPEVHGVFDVILNNYGPDTYIGSLHVEVEDHLTAVQIDELTRKITRAVFCETGVIVTAVGIYSKNVSDAEASAAQKKIRGILAKHEGVLQMHGFYLDKENKTVNCDVILDFALPDRMGAFRAIRDEIQEAFPDYTVQVALDVDVSD